MNIKKLTLILCAFLLLTGSIRAQGCVAIRNITGFGQFAELGYGPDSSKWMLDFSSRIFEAYTFLEGTTKITPADLRTGVTLHEVTNNVELTRLLSRGWSIAVDVPVLANGTAGALEHASGDYHTTHAFGLGDIRLTVYKWLLNESSSDRGNIQVGLGVKFATGNYHSEDYFYDDPNDPTAKVSAPVNVAIQLGDGGTGITTQVNAFYNFNKNISVYGNFFYLISPTDQNGVAAWPPNLLPPNLVTLYHEATYDVNSVPDSYTCRAGANFIFGPWVATGGLRYEGVPAHDLIGQDDGLRRAGHIFSAEPGVQYKLKKSFLYAFVGLPIDRRTIITVPDERMAGITGMPVAPTPGHFANYLVYFGYSFTL
jgi:hypothetical protein